MSLLKLLLTVAAIAATSSSTTLPPPENTEAVSTDSSAETFDSYSVHNLPPQLPDSIQLPNLEPAVPFYPPEPVTYLRAPPFIPNPPPNHYQVPIPSDTLTAPLEGSWNPNDDPTLYYELPASVTKEELPTKLFAKKYNPDIHDKQKPASTLPKKEIVLEPIDEVQYNLKQKEFYKTVDSLNKHENKKKIEQIKVPVTKHKRIGSQKTDTFENIISSSKSSTQPSSSSKSVEKDSANSETSFKSNINHESRHSNQNTENAPTRSSDADASGFSSYRGPKANPGERLVFHMVGHDGPMSYKWGYDTGNGPNRQFRFEERDKEGVVKGQFGYLDRDGKFRTMNYNAHPHLGFRMEPAPGSNDNK